MAIPTKGEEKIEVSAAPEVVYDLVSDMNRMGDWSPECRKCEWIGGAGGPEVGAEFLGHNQIGPYRWSVGGKVVTAERGSEFAFTTYLRDRESTRWRYRFEPSDAGTVVSESYESVWSTRWVRMSNAVTPRRKSVHRGMRQTLQRIKAAAEAVSQSGT